MPPARAITRGQIVAAAITLAGCAGGWVLLVASVKLHEMLVGVGVTLISAAATLFVVLTCGSLDARFRLRDVLEIWRMPQYLIEGSGQILMTLFKDILHIHPAESLYIAAPFETEDVKADDGDVRHDPVRAARRVLAVAYTSATPNFIILGIDPKTGTMLFHQVERGEVPEMTRRLGAQA